jgi:hypothetical protein
MNEQQANFEGWARVEVMGHQTHIGFVRTEAYGAAVMFRVDAPELPEREYVLESPEYVDGRWTPAGATVQRPAVKGHSVLVGAGSIYRIIPCDEAAALKAIETSGRTELKLISLPEGKALPAPEPRDFDCCGGNPEDGHRGDCEEFDKDDNPLF